MKVLISLTFLIWNISAYEDADLFCDSREHTTGLSRGVEGGRKVVKSRCSPFTPPIDEEPACSLGIAFKCTDNWEGCDEPDAWINGFQVLDVTPQSEIYVPYCCWSSEVKIEYSNCREIVLLNNFKDEFDYASTSDRVFWRFRCSYGNSSNRMTMILQECTYNTTTDIQSTTETLTTATAPGSTTAKTLDWALCFERFVASDPPLDYEEENVRIISSPTIETQKECADLCLRSAQDFGDRCNSYRYTEDNNSKTCALRRNYVNGRKVKWVREPHFVVYGNRTSTCDRI